MVGPACPVLRITLERAATRANETACELPIECRGLAVLRKNEEPSGQLAAAKRKADPLGFPLISGQDGGVDVARAVFFKENRIR